MEDITLVILSNCSAKVVSRFSRTSSYNKNNEKICCVLIEKVMYKFSLNKFQVCLRLSCGSLYKYYHNQLSNTCMKIDLNDLEYWYPSMDQVKLLRPKTTTKYKKLFKLSSSALKYVFNNYCFVKQKSITELMAYTSDEAFKKYLEITKTSVKILQYSRCFHNALLADNKEVISMFRKEFGCLYEIQGRPSNYITLSNDSGGLTNCISDSSFEELMNKFFCNHAEQNWYSATSVGYNNILLKILSDGLTNHNIKDFIVLFYEKILGKEHNIMFSYEGVSKWVVKNLFIKYNVEIRFEGLITCINNIHFALYLEEHGTREYKLEKYLSGIYWTRKSIRTFIKRRHKYEGQIYCVVFDMIRDPLFSYARDQLEHKSLTYENFKQSDDLYYYILVVLEAKNSKLTHKMPQAELCEMYKKILEYTNDIQFIYKLLVNDIGKDFLRKKVDDIIEDKKIADEIKNKIFNQQ